MNNPVRPKINIWLILIVIPMSGFLLFLAGCILIKTLFYSPYPQLAELLGSLLMLTGAYVFLRILLRSRILLPGQDYITVRTALWWKTAELRYEDIDAYSETIQKTKNGEVRELSLWYGRKRVIMSGALVGNYAACKQPLIRGRKRYAYAEEVWKFRNQVFTIVILLAAGLFVILLGSVLSRNSSIEPVQEKELSIIQGTVFSMAAIHGKHSTSLEIRIKEYPDFEFRIDDNCYEVMKSHDLLPGNRITSVYLGVRKGVYARKLAKTKPLRFLDKTVAYNTINVYTLRDDQQTYLSLYDYNIALKDGQVPVALAVVFLLGGAGLVAYAVRKFSLLRKPDPAGKFPWLNGHPDFI